MIGALVVSLSQGATASSVACPLAQEVRLSNEAFISKKQQGVLVYDFHVCIHSAG